MKKMTSLISDDNSVADTNNQIQQDMKGVFTMKRFSLFSKIMGIKVSLSCVLLSLCFIFAICPESYGEYRKTYKVAFILLVPENTDLSASNPLLQQQKKKIDDIKSNLGEAFSFATDGMGKVDTAYDVVVLAPPNPLIEKENYTMVFDGKPLSTPRLTDVFYQKVIAKYFYSGNHPDEFDFIAVYHYGYSSNIVTTPQQHWDVKRKITSFTTYSQELDNSNKWGSAGKLQGVGSTGNTERLNDSYDFDKSDMLLLLHEVFGHQWGVHSDTLTLETRGIHFGVGIQTTTNSSTVLYAQPWRLCVDDKCQDKIDSSINYCDTGKKYYFYTEYMSPDGTHTNYSGATFHPWILYFAGMKTRSEVPDKIMKVNLDDVTKFPRKHTIIDKSNPLSGTCEYIYIQEIINKHGDRVEIADPTPVNFPDIKEHWAENYINYVSARGIVQGRNGEFKPNDFVTRAEVLKMAYNGSMTEVKDSVNPQFDDVSESHWAYKYIADAKSNGYITGKKCCDSCSTYCFFPDIFVDRYEAAQIIYRLFLGNDSDILNSRNDITQISELDQNKFRDVQKGGLNSWAFDAVMWMANVKLDWVNGNKGEFIAEGFKNGTFGQDNNEKTQYITRAEMAKMIANSMNAKSLGVGSGYFPAMTADENDASMQDKGIYKSYGVTLGHLYEQIYLADNLNVPGSIHILGGDVQTIFQDGKISYTGEKNAEMFYFWSATGGSFSTTDNKNFSNMVWTPPQVSQKTTFEIRAVRGDNKGKVGYGLFYITVTPSPPSVNIQTIGARKDGVVQIVKVDDAGQTSGLGSTGTVKVNGKTVQSNWTADGINLNIFTGSGITWNTLIKPVHVEVFDGSGKLIADTFYPFSDIGQNEWYTRPIMKLWKENVLSGYSDTKSNAFGPNNQTTRAEYLKVALVADQMANNPGRTYPAYTGGFTDVTSADWFAKYVQFALTEKIINGCEPTKFCPADSLNRAAAAKITMLTFDNLLNTLSSYTDHGKVPSKEFSDVKDKSQWYYPFIYAAVQEGLVSGYSDGTFKPGTPINRAEMAKMNCVAAFGEKACMFSDETDEPVVTKVSPTVVELNKLTTFTVKGSNLPATTAFFITDCDNPQALAGGTELERKFSCTPSRTAGVKASVIKDKPSGTTLLNFKVVVTEKPVVESVLPLTAIFGQKTVFTVKGAALPSTTAFFILECAGVQNLGGTSLERKFSCTPSYTAGIKDGGVKAALGDNAVLYPFKVTVTELPKVTSVLPRVAVLDTPTTFTVTGQRLPDTTTFYITDCKNVQALSGGTSLQRLFSCTPSFTAGLKSGEVKDKTGGTVSFPFSVTVQPKYVPPAVTPKITSVSPPAATLNTLTTFTVQGENLTDATAFYLADCPYPTTLSGGTSQQRRFSCTPSYTTGIKNGEVKDTSGNMSFLFSVNVQSNYVPPTVTPKVYSVSPSDVVLGTPTTFTIQGENLTDAITFFVPECSGKQNLGGTSSAWRFSCTPSYTAGIKNGEVTDTGLVFPFTVNVQSNYVPPAAVTRVISVSPETATLEKSTIFTVYGENLPSTTALFINECKYMTSLGGTSSERRFRCTPMYKPASQYGLVKSRESDTAILYDFYVNVVLGTPSVSYVSPTRAYLNSYTEFIVKGTNLSDDTAFYMKDCKGVTKLGGTSEERRFGCTPSYTSGYKDGFVKDTSGSNDTIIKNFAINVLE